MSAAADTLSVKPPWLIDRLDRKIVQALVDNPAFTDDELASLLNEDPNTINSARSRPVLLAEVQREQRERSLPLEELLSRKKTRFFARALELSEQNENIGVAADMVKFLMRNDMDALAPPKKLAVAGDRENPFKVLVEVIGEANA